MEELMNALQTGLVTIGVAALTALCGVAVAYINVLKQKALANIDKIEDEKAKSIASAATEQLSQVVATVVSSIEQEEKQEILKAIEDGKVTRDELVNLKTVAIQRVKDQLLPDTWQIIQDTYKDANSYIADLVSQYVLQLKQSNK